MPDIKGVLRKAFPFISAAAALGGPPAVLAAGLLGKALGTETQPATVEPTESGILAALAKAAATPEQMLAAQKAEIDLQLQKARLEPQHQEEMMRLAMADRADAREREAKVKDHMPGALAVLAVVVALGCFLLVTLHGLKDGAKEAALVLLGVFAGNLKDVYGYYFGSSVGSERKTELLAKS